MMSDRREISKRLVVGGRFGREQERSKKERGRRGFRKVIEAFISRARGFDCVIRLCGCLFYFVLSRSVLLGVAIFHSKLIG